ncbi:hypothetical protein [Pandoraea oxalativorans]|uniref:EscI/YscI/HrpB family type III secretion system inner rod protein n=1 Tax=Pandoraea oxalativorans TaxID=573737 RepID=A0A0G3ICF8_9BURK|nr:hypothetical protein [Pandoraea oxalativorans]AKK24874.1 hypothetical protein MB84_29350 [Pandoraea oxalativorans]
MNIDNLLRTLGGTAATGQPGQPGEPSASLQQRFAALLKSPLDASSGADPNTAAADNLVSSVGASGPTGAAGLLQVQLRLHENAVAADAISKGVNFGVQGINKLVNQS